MSSPDPTCQVKDGAGAYTATTNGVDVTAGNTITINLVSSAGVSTWSISCIGTDELGVAATVTAGLTIDSVAKTATFTAPAAGSAYIFQSKVNNGVDVNGVAQPSYTTTFGVYVKTAGGLRVHAVNETFESDATFGWIGGMNSVIRNPAGSPPTGTGFRHITGGVEDGAAKLVVNADVDAAAAIAYSKLALTGDIVNADINATAAIAYSKLNLASSIVNADVAAAAAIAGTKISPDFGSQNVTTTGNLSATGSGVLTIGSSAAASGLIRIPWNGSSPVTIFAAKDNAAADQVFITYGTGNAWTIGNYNQDTHIKGFSNTILDITAGFTFTASAATVLTLTSTQATFATPTYVSSNDTKGTEKGRLPQHVQTTDATVTVIDSFTLASGTTVIWSVLFSAIKSDSTQGAAYSRTAVFRNNAGTVTQISTTQDGGTFEDDSTWDATLTFSGTTIQAKVTGKAATTIQWSCISTRLEVIP